MTTELADLVDSEGKVLPVMKEKIAKEFCELLAGDSWFYSLDMLMVGYALMELVDAIRDNNPSVKMPSIADMYYNKDAKYLELPWEVNKEAEIERSIENSDYESAEGDQEENEASIASNQDAPSKKTTRVPKMRESDEDLDDRPDSQLELSLGEPEEKQDEGVTKDQSWNNLPDTPSMTARDSKDYIGRLGSEISGSDHVPDTGLSEDGGGGR